MKKIKNKYRGKVIWDTEHIFIYIDSTFSLGITYEYGLISICLIFLKIDLLLIK